ncbi:helix-turn-helix domain-containing protein [uncultured Flavobacterium sp.]|uniref:ATP-binding protein n=1 Tax=uncultured Flavobacterium sp. TaxID=165435 RepID=UPI0030CA3D60
MDTLIRYEISILNDQKLSQSEIAYKVGANKSTISRELKRNSDGRSGEYRAKLAQKKCTLRHSVKNKKKTFTATIQEFIERYLKVIEEAFYSHRKEAVYTAGFVANIVYDGIRADKEIESLQNYLELEQLRFHNAFDFSIHATENVEFNVGLPTLLIQPFVENAILHGIVPKEENGHIEVQFDQQNGKLICTITDDGIGLSESKTRKENSVTAHKSMALDITKKRLEIMEATILQSAEIEMEELNENNQTGTKVTLKLPIQYV